MVRGYVEKRNGYGVRMAVTLLLAFMLAMTASLSMTGSAYAASADSLGTYKSFNTKTVTSTTCTSSCVDNKATAKAGKTVYVKLDSVVLGTKTATIEKGALATFEKKTGVKCIIIKSNKLTTQASVKNCMKGYSGKVYLDFRKQHDNLTWDQAKKVRNAFLKYAGADNPAKQIVLLY